MKKIVERSYVACLIICFILMSFVFATFQLDIGGQATKEGYERIVNYTYQELEVAEAPQGIVEEYCYTVSGVQAAYRALMFYSIHQNVRVYLDDTLMYSMKASSENAFGRSPGCIWNEIILSTENNGAQLRIELEPVYKSAVGTTPAFYFGVKYDIAKYIILRNLPSMLLSISAILAGFLFACFILYNYKNSQVDKSLVMLGTFSVNIGIWKLSDSEAIKFIFAYSPGMSIQPFVSLLLVTIPYTLFIKELHQKKDSWIWYIPCVGSLIHIFAILAIQLTGVADFRETLLAQHLLLGVALITIGFMVAYEGLVMGWSKKLKRNVLCISFCLAGTVLDLMVYYMGGEGTFLGILGFMIYIIATGLDSIKEAKQLMDIGMKARSFEQMAYHDQLTGLYNRTAYAEYIGQSEFDPEHSIVVMIDLNNLKRCNDLLGHERGDIYIRESARALQEVFGHMGNCYRMGGDEFCVLVKGITLEQCSAKIKEVRRILEERNVQYPDIRMEIACGYEMYDKRIDFDIGDTSRRADRMMYEEKFQMKQYIIENTLS